MTCPHICHTSHMADILRPMRGSRPLDEVIAPGCELEIVSVQGRGTTIRGMVPELAPRSTPALGTGA